MAEDKNVGDSDVGANGSKTLASESNGPVSAKPKGDMGDMFESLGNSKRSTSTPPVSVRSAPPPPPTSERMPLPDAKRTLLGIPSPTTPVSAPPPSVSSLPIPGTQRAGSGSLPNIAPPPRSPVPPAPGTVPANGAASPGKGLEMDWDDENEATHVFDKDAQGNEKAAGPGPAAGAAPAPSLAPNTTPTTARGTGTPPPPPPASASMRAAAKAISIPPAPPMSNPPVGMSGALSGGSSATVSQAVGPISQSQSERVLGAGTPPPPPASIPPTPPSLSSARRSTPPPPPSAMATGAAQRPSAPPPPPPSMSSPPASMKAPTPPSSLPPQPTHAPLVATLASAAGSSPSQPPASPHVQMTTTAPLTMPGIRTEPPRALEATTLVHPAGGGRSYSLVGVGLGVLSAGIGAFALVLFLNSRGGTISVTAVDGKGSALDHVAVFVDGEKTKCETSPCNLELANGKHTIKVISEGLATPEPKVVNVEAGNALPVPFEFKGEAAAGTTSTALAASAGTGLKIASVGSGLKLFVDGQDRGTLPQELRDLKVGEHKIRIAGNERYQALEKTVTITAGSMLDLGSVTPKVLKGKALLDVQTAGAKLSLQAPGEPARQLAVPVPPLDLDTSKGWTLHATKSGFEELVLPLTFGEGEPAEKTFAVALTPKGAASAPAGTSTGAASGGSNTTSTSAAGSKASGTTASAGSEAKGEGTLTISSMPASKVVIDGAPAGETPIMNKSVSAGTHKIMLINSDQDLKKTVTVTVKAGEPKKLIVNLKN